MKAHEPACGERTQEPGRVVYFRKQQSHPWTEECDHQGEATQKPSGAIDRDAESLRYLREDSDHAKFRSDQSECAERKNIDYGRNAHSVPYQLRDDTYRTVTIELSQAKL